MIAPYNDRATYTLDLHNICLNQTFLTPQLHATIGHLNASTSGL